MLLLLEQTPNLPLMPQLHTYFKILITQMKPHFSVTQVKQMATPPQQQGSVPCGLELPKAHPPAQSRGAPPGGARRRCGRPGAHKRRENADSRG